MATPIPFETVVGPTDRGASDGASAFNVLASATERNLDLVNAWTPKVDRSLISQPCEIQNNVLTPATGWIFDLTAGRGTYARKWGPYSFLSTCLMRSGATIAAGSGGNVSDTLVATLQPAWRPPIVYYCTAAFHSYAPCSVYINTNGATYLSAMSQAGQPFVTARVLIITAFWINTDVYFA